MTNQTMLAVPLFVLMGNLAGLSGMSRDLYSAAYAWALCGSGQRCA